VSDTLREDAAFDSGIKKEILISRLDRLYGERLI
jgi:hypothetical protein